MPPQPGSVTPFVVLTTQRSGSVLLVQALRSHPDIFCYHEMMRPAPPRRRAESLRAYLDESWTRRVARYLRPYHTTSGYLDRLYGSRPEERAVGFKLMYNHLRRHPELWLMFERRPILVLHLVRENILHTEVSAIRARETGVFHSRVEMPSTATIEVPTDDLVRRLERRDRLIAAHRRRLRRVPSLEISYDDVVGSRSLVSDRICDFFGVERRLLMTNQMKVTPSDLGRVIANYDDVARRLRGTRFAHLLES